MIPLGDIERYTTLCLTPILIASMMMNVKVRAETDKPDTSSEILYFEDYVEAIEEDKQAHDEAGKVIESIGNGIE